MHSLSRARQSLTGWLVASSRCCATGSPGNNAGASDAVQTSLLRRADSPRVVCSVRGAVCVRVSTVRGG